MTGKTKNAQPQLTKEQKDKRRKALIKLGSITVLTALVLLFATIAWFTMNKETGTSGMGVKVKGKSFDLITLSDDQDNKNGAFYSRSLTAAQASTTTLHRARQKALWGSSREAAELSRFISSHTRTLQ